MNNKVYVIYANKHQGPDAVKIKKKETLLLVTENYNTGNLKETILRRVQLSNNHSIWSVKIYSSKYNNCFPPKLG